jgi:hypothetical protein
MKAHALLIALTVAAGACSADTVAPADAPDFKVGQNPSGVQQALAEARAATARFHRFDVATESDYTFLFMDMCMVDESAAAAGGMGYHYVNTALLDGTVEVASPEALLYEPGPNGQLNLVALEYVIPAAAWTSAEAPVLMGQELVLNSFGLWALHVWLWKDNPSGIFASWNPRVSCDNAAASAAHAAH